MYNVFHINLLCALCKLIGIMHYAILWRSLWSPCVIGNCCAGCRQIASETDWNLGEALLSVSLSGRTDTPTWLLSCFNNTTVILGKKQKDSPKGMHPSVYESHQKLGWVDCRGEGPGIPHTKFLTLVSDAYILCLVVSVWLAFEGEEPPLSDAKLYPSWTYFQDKEQPQLVQ